MANPYAGVIVIPDPTPLPPTTTWWGRYINSSGWAYSFGLDYSNQVHTVPPRPQCDWREEGA